MHGCDVNMSRLDLTRWSNPGHLARRLAIFIAPRSAMNDPDRN